MDSWPAPDPDDAVTDSGKAWPGRSKKIRRTRPAPGRVARRIERQLKRDAMLLEWHQAIIERDARARFRRLTRLQQTIHKYREPDHDSEIADSQTKDDIL